MTSRRVYFVHFFWLGLAILVIIYLLFQLLSVVLPPKIVLTQPETLEIRVSQENYLIRGYVKRTYYLKINEELAAFDESGNFEKILNLNEDLNTFKIEAESRFGKTTDTYLKILRTN